MDHMDETPTPPFGADPVTPASANPEPPPTEPTPTQPAAPWVPSGSYPGSAPGGPFFWTLPAPPVEPSPHHGSRKLAAVIALVALLAGGLGASLDAVLSTPSATPSSAPSLPGSVAKLPSSSSDGLAPTASSVAAVASAVELAVVDINTTVASPAGGGTETGAGTGMIVTPSGEVLTNNHVVEQATSIKVTIAGHKGSYLGDIIGVDPTQDVALVQIVSPPKNLPYVRLGNSSSVKVGTQVVALGNALGLGGKPSVTSGTITAVSRTITASDELSPTATETLHNLFETDVSHRARRLRRAAAQPAWTGDRDGHRRCVLRLDHRVARVRDPNQRGAFIVLDMEHEQTTSKIIIGETAFLGILEGNSTFGSNPSSSSTAGVSIDGVISGSPAQSAGLTGGDTITSVDGTATNTTSSLQSAIRAHKPGDSVTVTYTDSSGASHTITVTLGAIPL